MAQEFISDQEYPHYFESLAGLRQRIVADLPLESGMHILDLATGHGYFAMAVAEQVGGAKIVGIDLSPGDVFKAREKCLRGGLANRIKILPMDATRMGFGAGSFDVVVNFLGLEDIHMTRGRSGVRRAFREVSEVLRPEGGFHFVVMPPEEMEGQAQKLENAVFSYACGATWLSAHEYQKMLAGTGFSLTGKVSYRTGKKLTPRQAGEYIGFACRNVPRIYGIQTPSLEKIWERFGSHIQASGLGYYSKVVLLRARKVA